jgi:hypothetical protein
MRKQLLFSTSVIIILLSAKSFAQTTDSTGKFSISGYVDAYYAHYTDSVGVGNYEKFPSIAPREGFGLNTAMLSARYDAQKVRGIITLHYGDVAKSTWSSTFNNIMEAHAGLRLCKKLWLDAGFFRTHVGAEGLHPVENFTSSVSVTTFYEPYYEAGVRLNYNPNEKLAINLFVLNGYNIFEDNNMKKSLGMLVTYALGDKGSIGYNNYIGDDTPQAADSISHMRVYQNLFFNYQISKVKIQIGLDYAIQQNSNYTNPKESAAMYSGVLGLKYQMKKQFAIYGRGEMFNDPEGFMSGVIIDKTNKYTGLKLWGATLGVEYKPTDNTYIRLEGRQLQMDKDQEIFHWNGGNASSRAEMLLNLGISF